MDVLVLMEICVRRPTNCEVTCDKLWRQPLEYIASRMLGRSGAQKGRLQLKWCCEDGGDPYLCIRATDGHSYPGFRAPEGIY